MSAVVKKTKYMIGIAAVVIISSGCAGKLGGDIADTINIIPREMITLAEYQLHYQYIAFDNTTVSEYFNSGVNNRYTLKFLKHVNRRFRSTPAEDRPTALESYLRGLMEQKRAEEMSALYEQYCSCEKRLLLESQQWLDFNLFSVSYADKLAFLRKAQDCRRRCYGESRADTLFGAAVKAREYDIRKMAIIYDKNLRGAGKEKRLDALKREMWGADAGTIEVFKKAFNRYQEKLVIYRKDLAEETEEKRRAMISSFRSEFFSPDIVRRLDHVDRMLDTEKARETECINKRNAIDRDVSLSKEEKARRILALENQIFGKDAGAFRRRQHVENGLRRMIEDD